jgi:uncharacterized phage infection (PIP) family protein YhgE
MATTVKQNGIAKKETLNVKKAVKSKLTEQVTKKASNSKKIEPVVKPIISLDERIQKFEQLKGLAGKRERLNSTLNELTRFNYNQDGSCSFYLEDSIGLEFRTTNSNLVQLVTKQLQTILEKRKAEIEEQILQFEL